MNKLTKEQAIVLSGFTGILMCDFSSFHEDVERRIGRPVWTHEFGSEDFTDEIQQLYNKDFLTMLG